MVIRTVTVGSATGLHAHAAASVATAAAELGTPITVRRVARPAVHADSMLSLLTLAATHGTELVVAADGDDAGPALDLVAALLAADDPAARAAAAERG